MQGIHQILAMVAASIGIFWGQLTVGVFGGHYKMIPVGFDKFTHQFFTGAAGVNIGRVDKVTTGFGIGIKLLFTFFLIGTPTPVVAEGHGAQREG